MALQEVSAEPESGRHADLTAFLSSSVQLLWDHWELSFPSLTGMFAPLLKRVLSLQAAQESRAAALGPSPSSPPGWLPELLVRIRAMDWTRRAKYRSLQAALPVLPQGSSALFEAWPTLLLEIFDSLSMPNYLSFATELLTDLLRSLRDSGGAADAGDPAALSESWLNVVVRPLISTLASARAPHADTILQAALPALLDAQPAALQWLLRLSSQCVGGGGQAEPRLEAHQCAQLVVGLLKAARKLGLVVHGDLDRIDAQFSRGLWPVSDSLLCSALLGADEHLALDTLDLICTHHKLTDMVTVKEMHLIQVFIPLRLKSCSVYSRRHIGDALRRYGLACNPKPDVGTVTIPLGPCPT